jgi:hypothetical protein
VLRQVAVEYGTLASGNASTNSFSDSVEWLKGAVPTEYLAIGLALVAAIYLIVKVTEAF